MTAEGSILRKKPSLWKLPDYNDKFVGRQNTLNDLQRELEESSYVILSGLGGIGKTQVALRYAHASPDYDLILYLPVMSEDSLSAVNNLPTECIDLAQRKFELNVDGFSFPKLIDAIFEHLATHFSKTLIILDNAESNENEDIQYIISKRSAKTHVFITARDQLLWGKKKPIVLPLFSEQDAYDYFLINDLKNFKREDILLLATELGFLPLALSQAIACLIDIEIDIAEYLRQYHLEQKESRSLLARPGLEKADKYTQTVYTTWQLCLSTLKYKNKYALEALRFCAYLSPDSIPDTLLETWFNRLSCNIGTTSRIREALKRYSLITVENSKNFRIHRLVQTVTRLQLTEEMSPTPSSGSSSSLFFDPSNLLTKRLNNLIIFMAEQFEEDVQNDAGKWEQLSSLLPHARNIYKQTEGLLSKTRPRLAMLIGAYLYARGAYSLALSFWSEAEKGFTRIYEKKQHPTVATARAKIGMAYYMLGDAKKALRYYKRSYAIRKKLYKGDHIDKVDSLNSIGTIYLVLDKIDKAMSYYKKSYNMIKTINPPNIQRAKAILKGNIGLAYINLGDFKKALACYLQCLIFDKKNYPENDPIIATSLNLVGVVQNILGKPKKALKYCRKSLEINKKKYGDRHPKVAGILNNIGIIYSMLGNRKKAQDYHTKSLALREENYHPDHPAVADSLNNIGVIYALQGEFLTASQHFTRSLAIRKKLYGENHRVVAGVSNNMAIIRTLLSPTEDTVVMHTATLALREKIYGKEHPDVADSLHNIGIIYNMVGKFEEAIPFLQRSLEIKEKFFSTDHPSRKQTFEYLSLSQAKTKGEKKLSENLSFCITYYRVRESNLDAFRSDTPVTEDFSSDIYFPSDEIKIKSFPKTEVDPLKLSLAITDSRSLKIQFEERYPLDPAVQNPSFFKDQQAMFTNHQFQTELKDLGNAFGPRKCLVFISHGWQLQPKEDADNHLNDQWSDCFSIRLSDHLECLGFQTLLDFKDSRLGSSLSETMHHFVYTAQHVLIIATNTYFYKTQWFLEPGVAIEFSLAKNRMEEGIRVDKKKFHNFILPIISADAVPPGRPFFDGSGGRIGFHLRNGYGQVLTQIVRSIGGNNSKKFESALSQLLTKYGFYRKSSESSPSSARVEDTPKRATNLIPLQNKI